MTSNWSIHIAALAAFTIPVLLAWMPAAALPMLPESAVHAVRAPLYADGSVQCSGADDLQDRVGEVSLRPVANGILFDVVLRGAAPNWDYYVELSQNGNCTAALQFYGFRTDGHGNGVFAGVYPADPGSYQFLVDVVSHPPTRVPRNPKHREIAPAHVLSVTLKPLR
jgi:hypothetical protein